MIWLVRRKVTAVWFAEAKTPDGYLTDAERKMRDTIVDAGAEYKIPRSVEDVVRMLRRGPQ